MQVSRAAAYVALSISAAALVYMILSLLRGTPSPEMFAIGQNSALFAIAAFRAERSR